MLLIRCPYCGERPEIEFVYGGQAHISRPTGPDVTDQQWADFLYARTNVKGVHSERWRHVHGCGQFFNAQRDTTTDHFVVTYRRDELPPVVAAGDGTAPAGNKR